MQIETEVRSFLGQAAWTSDEGTIDDYAQLFAEDAVLTFAGSTETGRDAIVAATRTRRDSGMSGPGSGRRHFVTTLRVTPESDSAAQADSYVLVVADTPAGPSVSAMARYDDRLVKQNDTWQIAQRVVYMGGAMR